MRVNEKQSQTRDCRDYCEPRPAFINCAGNKSHTAGIPTAGQRLQESKKVLSSSSEVSDGRWYPYASRG